MPHRATAGGDRAPAWSTLRAGAVLLWLGLVPTACVTTYEDAPFTAAAAAVAPLAVPVAIPLGSAPVDPEQRTMLELYDGVLRRLEEAVAERDLPAVNSLLDGYERSNLPPIVLDRLRGYRAIAHGMAFTRHAAAAATLRLVEAGSTSVAAAGPARELPSPPPIGAPLRLEFTLPPGPEAVRLGGRDDDDPVGFAVALTVDDLFVDGGSRSHSCQDFVWVEQTLTLAGDVALRLPVGLDLPGGDVVQRTVHVRIDLLPGYLNAGGWRSPVPCTTIAATAFTQWPPGFEAIEKAPLATLREAIKCGDAAHFPHVFLGAVFSQAADREAALGLLVDQVRYGTMAQATVAMATLHRVSGVALPIGDREGWLAWWQLRR